MITTTYNMGNTWLVNRDDASRFSSPYGGYDDCRGYRSQKSRVAGSTFNQFIETLSQRSIYTTSSRYYAISYPGLAYHPLAPEEQWGIQTTEFGAIYLSFHGQHFSWRISHWNIHGYPSHSSKVRFTGCLSQNMCKLCDTRIFLI